MWITGLLLGILVTWTAGYLIGRHQRRLLAYGRDSYIRFYPNPGVGVRWGSLRVAASVVGGIEVFRRGLLNFASGPVWIRRYSLASRVQRPGGR